MSQDLDIMLIRQINGALTAGTEAMPDKISDLSFSQMCLLAELFELNEREECPMSLSLLAREIGFSKATICSTLKGLRKSGYVKMWTDDSDSRRKEIALTEKAFSVRSEVNDYISTLNGRLFSGIPEGDLQSLKNSLHIILRNAKNFGAESP